MNNADNASGFQSACQTRRHHADVPSVRQSMVTRAEWKP